MRYTYKKERRDPQIQSYETKSGKRWRIKFSITLNGKKHAIEKNGLTSFDAARSCKQQIINTMTNTHNWSNITVKAYFEQYCEEKFDNGSWRYPTYVRHKSLFKNHFYPQWGHVKMVDVNRGRYQIWLTQYTKAKAFSIKTARAFNSSVASVFNDAVLNDVIQKIQFRKLRYQGKHLVILQ